VFILNCWVATTNCCIFDFLFLQIEILCHLLVIICAGDIPSIFKSAAEELAQALSLENDGIEFVGDSKSGMNEVVEIE